MRVGPLEFRSALSRFASGVTVVTVNGPDGEPVGFTATAFSSLSLDPPLALVCAAKGKRSHTALTEAEAFAVNVLAEGQERLAVRFADPSVHDRFAGLRIQSGTLGVPLLPGTVAGIECRRWSVFDGGDHSVFVGEVEALRQSERPPLVYYAGRFGELRDPSDLGNGSHSDWLVGATW